MSDINTVTLSGALRGDVESYEKEDLVVSRFYLGVADAHEGGEEGVFKVVAFGKTGEYARTHLSDGERVSVVGKLLAQGGSRGPTLAVGAQDLARRPGGSASPVGRTSASPPFPSENSSRSLARCHQGSMLGA